jgi:glycosyltransferase involved in cell wall biosynthesis
MVTVSIVIPAYNEEKYIGRLLASLKKLPKENILEILIVDNSSSDKTCEVVRIVSLGTDEFDRKIRLLEEPRKGVAWARTRGVQEARGEIIAFLDADTCVTDEWFSKLLGYFSSKKIVCVSGPTYYYDVSFFVRIGVSIYWWIASVIVARIITGYMGIFANLAVRADSLKKIGGIDTSVEFYGDDTNIARRLSKVGKVIFPRDFFVYASGRRLNTEGLFITAWRYTANFFSEVLVHKPVTKGYTEVR